MTASAVLDTSLKCVVANVDSGQQHPPNRSRLDLHQGQDEGIVPEGASLIVIIDDRVLISDCLAKCLMSVVSPCFVATFPRVESWLAVAAQYSVPLAILARARFPRNGEKNLERDLLEMTKSPGGSPVILVSDVEDAEHVLIAIESGARGYIPTSVTIDVAVEAIRLVTAGGTFVPATSLFSAKRKADTGIAVHDLFTKRQAAVVEALRTGKANKRIAYDLNMRESTVKVHVRNIMKKLHAKNRTEVAYLTRELFVDHRPAE